MSLFKAETGIDIEKVAQRTDIAHYMNVTKVVTAAAEDTVYHQLGTDTMAMTESPSAQTKERKFINEKSSRKNITSYAPSFAFEFLLAFNNPAIRIVYDIYTKRKTGSETVVEMVTVDMFDTASSGYYPARKGNYAVEVSSCDDDDDMIIKGNFNGQGDEASGWFNPSTGVWSDTEPSVQTSETNTENTDPSTADEEPKA